MSGVIGGFSAIGAVFTSSLALHVGYGLLSRFVTPTDVAALLS